MTEPVLTIQNLSVVLSRNGQAARALENISFDVAPGEIVALVGESGSGKSTVGRALQGLLPRGSQPQVTGSIRVAGVELVGAPPRVLRSARRHLVRAIAQDPMAALDPTMSIRRQMRESTEANDATIEEWLRRTGLNDPQRIADALPHRLSGGQCQRVLIAMSMMAHPKLLIADEPTTALDVTTQAQILDLLRDLARAEQAAILFVTHDLNVAASLADRLAVLHAGRIVEHGDLRDVVRKPAHAYTAGLLASRFDFDSDRSRPLPTLSQSDPAKPWPEKTISSNETALRLIGVSKSFAVSQRALWGRRGSKPVLKSVDLSIKLGECVALVGESGAGKTTLLRIAAGLLPPDSGAVSRFDRDPPQVIYQDAVSALTPWLSIGEQIGERLRTRGVDTETRRRRLEETLELVGLDPPLMSGLPAELSVGQCQRAVIARAIVVPPKLLLCDEPISALDVSLAAAILNLLGDLRRRLGMAMLFVTHDLAAARIIADRIAVLQSGELVEDGDPDTLITAPKAAYTRSLIAAMPNLPAELGPAAP